MKRGDFRIGGEFYSGAGKWRCTDVGTRVIVAISLDTRRLVRTRREVTGEVTQESVASNDPRDLAGPPYMLAEYVFDECDMGGCYTTAEEVPL